MKIGFLHLSDLHFSESEHTNNITNMFQGLYSRDFDQLIILVSGDIADTGSKSEYKIASEFFGEIERIIRNIKPTLGEIPKIFCPGNHDIKFSNFVSSEELYSIQKELLDQYNRTTRSKLIDIENEKFDNYYEFLSTQNDRLSKNIIQRHNYSLADNYRISINIVNSALFSAYTDDKNDNDKGYHFLRKVEINKINNDNSDFSIVVMHHTPEWFSDRCKYDLIDKFKAKVDICFLGHEHKPELINRSFGNTKGFYTSHGGACLQNDGAESVFSFLVYNTSSHFLESYHAKKDPIFGSFIYSLEDEKPLRPKSSNGFEFQLSTYFEESFYIDNITSTFTKSLFDIFVFPQLEEYGQSKTKKMTINDPSSLFSKIQANEVICIKGSRSSGKTTLSKFIFSFLEKSKIVVYLQSTEISETSKLRTDIDNAIIKQYGNGPNILDYYKLKPRAEKVLIIDNFHLIKKNKEVLDILLGEFSTIIITSSKEFDFEEVIQLSKSTKIASFRITELSIKPFSKRKREDLIKKVFDLLVKNPQSERNQLLFDATIKYVRKQIKIINHTPCFTIIYTKDFINSGSVDGNKNRIFNEVFRAELTYRIKDFCTPRLGVDLFNLLCEILAYKVYKSEEYPIKIKTIIDIVLDYNLSYDSDVDPLEFIEIAKNAGIINQFIKTNLYVFSSDNYFGYYVAIRLLSLLGTEEGNNDLKMLLDNILVRINSTVLLFFSFLIGKRTEILTDILTKMNDLCSDVPEISFTNRNFTLDQEDLLPDIKFPSDSDKESIQLSEEEREEKLIESNEVIHVDNMFSLEIDPRKIDLSKGVKAIRYLEVISKALPDFFINLERDEKRVYIQSLYRIPNKVIYIAINDVQRAYRDNYTDLCNDLREENPGEDIKLLINRFLIKIKNFFSAFTISMYELVAQNAIEKSFLEHFRKHIPGNDLSYELAFLTFCSEVYNLREFSEKAISLYSNTSDTLEENMIRIIVSQFLSVNKEQNIMIEQKIQSEIFGNKGKIPKLKDRR